MLSKIRYENNFIESILDGMSDWVRVLDCNDTVIYVNEAMSEEFSECFVGRKCYEAIGRTGACGNCISHDAIFKGKRQEKEQIINGKVFSVMSSPVKDNNGNVISIVEVFRDITQIKNLNKKIVDHNNELLHTLEMAKKMQLSLIPKNYPDDKIDFSIIYTPCESLSGDFIDIFKIDKNHLGVYIADVSGHGVSAAMLTVFLKSSINKKLLSPSAVLNELHHEFNTSSFDKDLYITIFYAVINTDTNKITFSNAGHGVHPVIFNNNKLDILHSSGLPISNWADNPTYTDNFIDINQGDSLFFYSDGITELKNSCSKVYGEKRLIEYIKSSKFSTEPFLQGLLNNAYKFAGINRMAKISDDITLALIKFK